MLYSLHRTRSREENCRCTYIFEDVDEAEVFGGSGEGGEGSGWTNQRKQENRERIVGGKRAE
jgi:hypothetical protein